jgi:alanine racemase
MALRALASVNLAAVKRNVVRLRRDLADGVQLCAVVKADGYGHGAVEVALAAQEGGATWLAVATAEEAEALRSGGVTARILVMGALAPHELPVALAARADVVAWSESFVDALLAAEPSEPVGVHVKFDTGMGRLGTRDADIAFKVAERIAAAAPTLELAGAMTHFATADEDPEFLSEQLAAFSPFADEIRRRFPGVLVHAANSAATLREPASHFDLVRCGVAIYGLDPMQEDPALRELEPALELTTYVAAVKPAAAGESTGYGRRFVAERDTWIATLPIGYADGVRRAFTNNAEVLIGGRAYPLVGTVSMDNVTVELGPDHEIVHAGDTATIIGASGDRVQTAEQLAARIGTINYEIVCGISSRVPRRHHRDGEPW